MRNKRGQVWVETVLYTLISLLMIGLVLAYAKPKIEEMRDKATIEQSIEILKSIDSTVMNIVQGGAGNKRVIEMKIERGTLKIDGSNDRLIFEMDSMYQYSENGTSMADAVLVGDIKALTEYKGKFNKVTLVKEYDNYNVTYKMEDENKSFTSSSIPYKLYVINKGNGGIAGAPIIIDFELE